MLWRAIIAIALVCSVAEAQPVVIGGPRLRTDCSTNDLLKWNGTTWVCSSGPAVTGSGSSGRSVRWASASSIGNGGWTDDGTNVTSQGTVGVTGDFAVATNKFTVAASTGNSIVGGTLGISGDVAVNTNKFNVTASSGNTSIAGTLGVTGLLTATAGGTTGNNWTTTGTGDLVSADDLTVADDAIISDTLSVTGDFAVNTNKFTVTASSGNTSVAGTLGVTGLLTATAGGTTSADWTTTGTGDLVSGDDLTVADDATITDVLSVQGQFVMGNSNSDSHNINGSVSHVDDGSAYNITSTPSGTTAQRIGFQVTMQGTADTTSGNITMIGGFSSISTAESAGGNTLINVGHLYTASGGDVNVAMQTNAGNNFLNASSGNTAIGITTNTTTLTSKLTVNGSIAMGAATGPIIVSGSGAPESSVTAPVGSLYMRTGGGAGTSFCVKESGSGNTGWVCK